MEKIKIKLVDFYYSCSEGCCLDYGTTLFINGKEIEQQVEGLRDYHVSTLLEALGITNFEVESVYEGN